MLDKSEYCLIPSIEDGNSTVQVMVCFDVLEPTLKAQIQPIGKFLQTKVILHYAYWDDRQYVLNLNWHLGRILLR